ncbi:MAG: hypothetical protein AUK53_07970 [Betaproteobacteria bacterium CG2_30_59_46]|nr:MAG: hypothetical protein AUK53_07970 [Betaproteobacteria bacterium CG2_30_59_46]
MDVKCKALPIYRSFLTIRQVYIQCIYDYVRVGFQPKEASNKKKHSVSFEAARSVFYDEFAVQFFDGKNGKKSHGGRG